MLKLLNRTNYTNTSRNVEVIIIVWTKTHSADWLTLDVDCFIAGNYRLHHQRSKCELTNNNESRAEFLLVSNAGRRCCLSHRCNQFSVLMDFFLYWYYWIENRFNHFGLSDCKWWKTSLNRIQLRADDWMDSFFARISLHKHTWRWAHSSVTKFHHAL